MTKNTTKTTSATVNGVSSVASAQCINDQQWTKYHTRQGHGPAAEDANALWDRMHGKSVDKVGVYNFPNGADRITNGVQIQTKYCADAAKSVGAAFENGSYRYSGMKLEVPREQYDEAVRIMRGKIANGEVSGISDPKMAEEIVIKGHCTYDEAVRIAKAGNIDSLKFDAKCQTVSCGLACGLSFALTYWTAKSQGLSHTEALKAASKRAAKSGVTAMVTGVAAQQLLRTEVGRNFAAIATKAAKPVVGAAMKTEMGKQMVSKTASVIAGKQVTGVTARNVMTKTLRTNAVTSAVVFAVTTAPDIVKVCRGKMSGKEFAKNTASNAAGIGGGWAGATSGAAIGTMICPGIGTFVGGIIGSIGGGIAASSGIRCLFG